MFLSPLILTPSMSIDRQGLKNGKAQVHLTYVQPGRKASVCNTSPNHNKPDSVRQAFVFLSHRMEYPIRTAPVGNWPMRCIFTHRSIESGQPVALSPL